MCDRQQEDFPRSQRSLQALETLSLCRKFILSLCVVEARVKSNEQKCPERHVVCA